MSMEMSEILSMIQTGRYAELESKARDVLQHHPSSGLAWKALGFSLTVQGKDPLRALLKATALLPGDAEAHRNLGDALQGIGRLDEAVASYGRSLEINPLDPETYNNLGNARRGLGRLQEAVTSYRQALSYKPEFAEAHGNLGNALRGLGHLDLAVASYRRALEVEPCNPAACNNLGNALLELKELDAAVVSYRRALEINPGFAEAHSNLGNALRRLGRLDEAVASYRQALHLNPGFAAAHSNLSDTLRELGQLADAAVSSRRAIEIDPDLATAHNSLGNALLDLGELDEAARSYRRALVLRPDFAEAYTNLGLVLRQQGRTAEAEASCRAALERNPDAAAALVLLAELQADHGRFAEAGDLFRHALVTDPASAEALAGTAYLRKMTVSDAEWSVQARRIAGRGLPPRQEVYLRFALGKYFDDVKDFEQAFVNYQRAHELLKRSGARYDRQQQTRRVDRTIESHDQEWAKRIRRREAFGAARPVFIVGMPRSGTSLAEQILASHPAVFGAGELTFWNNAARERESSALNAEANGGRVGEQAAEYLELLHTLSPDALRIVDKMPANFWSLGLIHEAVAERPHHPHATQPDRYLPVHLFPEFQDRPRLCPRSG